MGEWAGLFFAAAFGPYLWATWKKKERPSIVSFGIWSVVDAITLATMWANDTLWVDGKFNWLIVAGLVGAVAVFFSALLLVERKPWTWVDKTCLALATMGIIAWVASGDPFLGQICSLFATLIAVWPSAAEAWGQEASKAGKLTWTMFLIGCLLQIGALTTWSKETAAQPLTFLAINTTMAGIVWFRKPPSQEK